MTEPGLRRRGPRTLSARLALWITLSSAVSLAVFAVVAYFVVIAEERAEVADGAAPEDETPADIRNEVLIALAFAAPVGLTLAAVGASWLTRRALAPVDRMIEAASEITAARLDRRLPEPERADELQALTRALNGTLEGLQRGFSALSMFAANASHELRTPLAAVHTELEIALRRPRSVAEWEAAARTALEELGRLSRLVDALLQLARAGTESGVPGEPVDVIALAEQVVATAEPAAARGGVVLEPPAGEPAVVMGAKEALSSALANLLANAIRSTPRGGVVTVAVESAGRDRVVLAVEDTGPGVPLADRAHVFEPFARGAVAADSQPEGDTGFGLGLAIARRITEAHGGCITVGDRPGGGARFAIELPAARGA